jgi:hypothetical protein
MKFKEYLTEEYLTRDRSFEIFKNPNRKEIQDLFRKNENNIRFLIDEKDKKTWYIFSYRLLHKYALEHMGKEKVIPDGLYRSGEIALHGNKIVILVYYGVYEVLDGKPEHGNMKPDNDDYKWLVDTMKFFGKPIKYDINVYEEYFTRVKPKYIDTDIDCEIYKNPTLSELKTLDREFRKIHVDLIKNNHSNIETLRMIFTEGGPWWASTSMLLHSEIAKKIDRFAGEEIRAMGWIDGNVLNIDISEINDWKKIVKKTLGKTAINYRII